MKIGMFTSGYQRNPLEHVFQDAKEFGYDYIRFVVLCHHSQCHYQHGGYSE